MAAGAASRGDPKPIDAQFEPSDAPRSNLKMSRSARPSRSVTRLELMLASLAATGLGALLAIAVAMTGGGSSTGTLAQELDALNRNEAELSARSQQMSQDLLTARVRLEGDAEKLNLREAG